MLFKPARKIAAAAAVALAAGTVAAVAPATAATAAPLTYTCEVPLLGSRTFTVTADTNLPATLPAGSALSGKADFAVTVPNDVRNLMAGLGDHIEGTADIKAVAFGAATTLPGVIPSTPVPTETGPFTIPASAPIAGAAPATPGTYEIHAGDFVANAKLTKTTGETFGPVALPCKLDPGQNTLVDTLAVTAATPTPTPTPSPVVKVDTTTTVKAKFAKKAKTITAVVKVKGADATKGTGKVKVTLKLGKKKVKTVRAKLAANGVAKAVFKKITKKGKYKLEAVYTGSATQNGSTGKATLKVK